MGFIDVVKDAASIAQKADNIELYRMLLDVQKMALDMQQEISDLKDETKILRDISVKSIDIIRCKENYLTLRSDEQKLQYCTRCWDVEQKLVQLGTYRNPFECPNCKSFCKRGEW